MFDELIRRWWIVALRGLAALGLGVAVFLAPETTVATLVAFFAVFAIAEGIFAMGAGLSLNWLSLFLEGVVGAGIGLFTWVYQPAAIEGFLYLIVAWAMVTGLLEVIGAARLRRMVRGPMVQGEWLLGASGALSLAFGIVIASQGEAWSRFEWTLGGYAVLSGALLLALAFNIRSWRRVMPPLQA
jgi:uncharacterized membrane protein HdeD (DUF308 family)